MIATTPNPYLNRLPIRHPDEFYGREQDIRWLMERILHEHPQCCSITGPRRIGKTSLLTFLAHPEGARRRFAHFFQAVGEGLLLVYADMSLRGSGTLNGEEGVDGAAMHALDHLLRALEREARARLPEPLAAQLKALRRRSGESWHGTLEAMEDALELLGEAEYRVVFLLDELDVMEMLPAQLAQALRALVMENRIGYVTASLNPLHELLIEGRTSPLYNLFSTRSLNLLEPEEARLLLVEPARMLGVLWSDEITESVLRAIGGHPDLLKIAATHIWDLSHANECEPTTREVLDALRPDANRLFTSLWKHLSAGERQLVATLASGRRTQDDPVLLRSLRRRALLTESEEPELFAPLFGEWVAQQPEAPEPLDDLRLEGRWLVVEGDRRQLTPTEAKLADLLLKRRGQTVSREELQQAIWDEVDPTSKALDTTVQRLREKIETDRANPRWLVTVRGEGYAFKE